MESYFMYDKHGNLVDADASGAKASKKHLESPIETRKLSYGKDDRAMCPMPYVPARKIFRSP